MRSTLFFFLIIPLFIFSQNKKADEAVLSFRASAPMQHANFSLLVSDVKTGETLVETNAEQSIIPASVMKLLTTATALEVLGKDFEFNTRLAYEGSVKEGVLDGNIHIIGGGDPALGSKRFGKFYTNPNFLKTFVEAVKKAGITSIEGEIIADVSLYGKYVMPPTWSWEDMGNYWGAQPCALSVYDNMYTAYFNSSNQVGKKTVISSINYKELPIQFDNHVVSSNKFRDNAYIFGAPYDENRYVLGDIPKNRKLFSVKGSIPNPAQFMGLLLKSKLNEAGINVSGDVKVLYETVPVQRAELLKFPSPKLQLMVLTTNLRSVNLYAEHMLRHIGRKQKRKTDLRASLDAVKEFWQSKGMNINGMHIYDGSGLSHFNTITAQQMIFLLRYMANDAQYKFAFKNSLPVMGKSGTLGYMGKGTSAANRVWAKSGSMNNIRAYSGYIQTKSKKELCFFLAVNHYNGTTSEIKSGIVNLLSTFVDSL